MNKHLLRKVAELFDLLRNDGAYLLGNFDNEEDRAAASDLFEHDNMICVAAWKMLNGFETLQPHDKAALDEPILFGTRLLKIRDRDDPETTREIGHLDELMRYARNLEDLRQLCLRSMQEP